MLGALPATYFTQPDFDLPFFVIVSICGLVGGSLIGRFVPRKSRKAPESNSAAELTSHDSSHASES